MLHVTMIGYGAIGSSVLKLMAHDPHATIDTIIVPDAHTARTDGNFSHVPDSTRLISRLNLEQTRPDLIVECAGHTAIEEHVIPALEHGIPCLVASVGALSDSLLKDRLESAASKGHTQVQLLSGAIGAIDALAAAKFGGLDEVIYTGRKPPLAWKGTPAEENFDLALIDTPTLIFSGTAREAARRFPKNANVAATVALASLGLDNVQVQLYADPSVRENQHHIKAKGAFGQMEMTLNGTPLAANPKTSALTVYSIIRGITNRAHALVI